MLHNKYRTLEQNRCDYSALSYIWFSINTILLPWFVYVFFLFEQVLFAFSMESICNIYSMYDRIKPTALSTLKLGLVDLVHVVAEFIFILINLAHFLSRTCTMDLVLLGSRMKGLRSVMKSLCDSSILMITLGNYCSFFTELVKSLLFLLFLLFNFLWLNHL